MAHAVAVTRQRQKDPGYHIENMGTTQSMGGIHMRSTEILRWGRRIPDLKISPLRADARPLLMTAVGCCIVS